MSIILSKNRTGEGKKKAPPENAHGTDSQGVDQETMTKKTRVVHLSPTSPVNQEIISALEIFLDLAPPQRVVKHITTLLLLYLIEEPGVIDSHKAIAEDVYLLFGFLNAVADNPV